MLVDGLTLFVVGYEVLIDGMFWLWREEESYMFISQVGLEAKGNPPPTFIRTPFNALHHRLPSKQLPVAHGSEA